MDISFLVFMNYVFKRDIVIFFEDVNNYYYFFMNFVFWNDIYLVF